MEPSESVEPIGRAQPGSSARRRHRAGRHALVVLGCVIALGAGYAAAAGGLGAVTVFGTGLPGGFAGYQLGGVAAGSDGSVWYSAAGTTPGSLIERITPDGTISEFSAEPNTAGYPGQIAEATDGNIWFSDFGLFSQAIGRITPDGQITEFPAGSQQPASLAAGQDGNMWFTAGSSIGKVTPDGQIATYSAGLKPTTTLAGITMGFDGDMWFLDSGNSSGGIKKAIGKIAPDGTIKEFSAPPSYKLDASSQIVRGPDGNLWFTEYTAIARLAPDGSHYTEFSNGLPANSHVQAIAAGADGNMWFTDVAHAAIGKITPDGTITEFSIASAGLPLSTSLVTGPDGNLWLTSGTFAAPTIARIDVGAPAASVAPPKITGSGQQGDPQLCDGAVWSDWAAQQPSMTANTFDGYQWLLDGDPIAGQTAETYTPTVGDLGHRLSCKVTATYTLFPATVSAASDGVTVTGSNPTLPDGGGGSTPVNTTASATVQVATTTTTITTTSPPTTPPPVRKPAAADHIDGSAKADHLAGSRKADIIKAGAGNDWVNGGAGNDTIYGGPGNDNLFGGPGSDTIYGGPGNDTIHAADGAKDTVDCGPGHDTVYADKHDKINKNCERIHRA